MKEFVSFFDKCNEFYELIFVFVIIIIKKEQFALCIYYGGIESMVERLSIECFGKFI